MAKPATFPLPATLQRAVGAWLEATDLVRAQGTCRALRAALAHDALWRPLFARHWGRAATNGEDVPWQHRFAERAMQRRRALENEPVRACKLRSEERQFYLAILGETLFVSNENGELCARALPKLELVATWVLHQARRQCYTYLWPCGGGSRTRLVTYSSAGHAAIRLWCPQALSRPAPDPRAPQTARWELELAEPARTDNVHWCPFAVFADDRRATVLAVYTTSLVLEWSRESGVCLRQLRLAHPVFHLDSPIVQFDGRYLLVQHGYGDEQTLVSLDLDCPLQQPSLAELQSPRVWDFCGWRNLFDLYRGGQDLLGTPARALSDLLRPRPPFVDRAARQSLGNRIHALAAGCRPYDFACTARFLVILARDETLFAFDYGKKGT